MRPFLLGLLLVLPALSGCLDTAENESPPAFAWPEPAPISGCELTSDSDDRDDHGDDSDVSCDQWLETSSAVIDIAPLGGEVILSMLDGTIARWAGNETDILVNLTTLVSTCHNEQGLLAIEAMEPNGSTNQALLAYVEAGPCDPSHVSDVVVAVLDLDQGLDAVPEVVLRFPQVKRNHNGADLIGLADGSFLLSLGDGGGSNDPYGHGQNTTSLLGGIIHFSIVNGSAVPASNVSDDRDDFLLHHGLRNPFRMALDPTGGLWIADVGQRCWEEVNYIPHWNVSTNFGWNEREGHMPFSADAPCDTALTEPSEGLVDPVLTYGHEDGRCSILGGPWVEPSVLVPTGGFLYGDFCSGEVWVAHVSDAGIESTLIATTNLFIVGLAVADDGAILVSSWTGGVYALSAV
jgi:glucose/arabinose dehydrogenase